MAQLKNGASVADLERSASMQASLRKCEFFPHGVADSFIRWMKDNKHIALKNPANGVNRNAIWVLTSKLGFTDDGLVDIMQAVHTWFRVAEPQPRPTIIEEV